MRHTLFTLAVAFGVSATAGFAHEYTLGDLTIDHPRIIETAATAKTAAGYMTITNAGEAAARLVEAQSAMPRTELHITEVDADGVARMIEQEAVEIPAGGSVTFEPGGLHVMFMGLEAPLAEGEEVPATLVFEGAGEVEVTFDVEARAEGTAAEDHAGHGDGGHGDGGHGDGGHGDGGHDDGGHDDGGHDDGGHAEPAATN